LKIYSFFIEEEPKDIAVIRDKDTIHHIYKVLRFKEGDRILLMDGKLSKYEGEIKEISQLSITLKITKKERIPKPPIEITLVQGIPKHPKMDIIVESASGLGIYRIIPLISKRTVAKTKNVERWRSIAKTSLLTSRMGLLCDVCDPTMLDEIKLNQELVIVAWEEEKNTHLRDILRSNRSVKSIAVFIGPEGGFEKEEVCAIQKMGGIPVSLGNALIKTEYAGLFVLSSIFYEFGL